MVTTIPITTSASTQYAPSKIAAISQTLAPMLIEHGEASLIAGLAHAIGVNRILEAATATKPPFSCEAVSDIAPPPEDSPLSIGSGQGTWVTYYVAGCDGAKRLAFRLDRSIFKIGYTCELISAQRLEGLNDVVYGGWSGYASPAENPQFGWDNWRFARHVPRDTAHLILPPGIEIDHGLWRVWLPPGVNAKNFDRVVTAAMASKQLDFWVGSAEGSTHCNQKNLRASEFTRYSRNPRTGILRTSEELYVYAPRRDAAWFAAILVQALDHVRRCGPLN